ncbi:hypothetical protein Golob_012342, partial [Gossypium lobatum]|nr:hypothetical protein [Gossypium lobatum]
MAKCMVTNFTEIHWFEEPPQSARSLIK